MIEDRSLMTVSELEQKIVSSEASSDHFKMVTQMIADKSVQ